MSICNTKLFYGCCPSATPVTEVKKPEVKPLPAPVPPKPCCHTFKVENITVVGEEVFVILDDCTFLKAPKTVLDKSVSEYKNAEAEASLEALQKALTELTTKVNSLGNTSSETVLEILKTAEGKAAMLEVLKGTEVQNINEETQGYLLAK